MLGENINVAWPVPIVQHNMIHFAHQIMVLYRKCGKGGLLIAAIILAKTGGRDYDRPFCCCLFLQGEQ